MSLFLLILGLLVGCICYKVLIAPKFNPLQQIAGPPYVWKGSVKIDKWVQWVLWLALVIFNPSSPSYSSRVHNIYVQRYGRSMRIWGPTPVGWLPTCWWLPHTQFCVLGGYPLFDIGSLVYSTCPDKSDNIRKTMANTRSYFKLPRKWSDFSGGKHLQTSAACYCTHILQAVSSRASTSLL